MTVADRTLQKSIWSLFMLYLATCISAQIHVSQGISDGLGLDIGHYSRNTDDNSFIDSNEIPRYQKKEMQSELLHLLGLKQRPSPSSLRGGQNNSAPQFMLDLYNSLSSTADLELEEMNSVDHARYDMYHREALSSLLKMGTFNYTSNEVDAVDEADTIMSLPVRYKTHSIERHGNHRYHFEVNSVPGHDILTTAELRVYRDIADSEFRDGLFCVKIFQITGQGEDRRVFMDSVVLDRNDVGWIVFDVTYGSHILQTYPGAKISLQLIAEDLHRQEVDPDLIGLKGIGSEELLEPFMVAFFKTHEEVRQEHLSRVRRSGRKNPNKSKRGSRRIQNVQSDPIPGSPYSDVNSISRRPNRECRRRTFYVNFDSLDWSEWIIAPEGYHAFSCEGECSFPLHNKLNATNHAIVQTLVHILNPTVVPQACCAPTKLGPIQVLYFDDSTNVVLRKYKNMVVKACGCH